MGRAHRLAPSRPTASESQRGARHTRGRHGHGLWRAALCSSGTRSIPAQHAFVIGAAWRVAYTMLGSLAGGEAKPQARCCCSLAVTSFLQDLRFAARMLRRAPGIAVSIAVILALGIGVNSAIFGVVDGLVLHPVNYPHPEELVFLWSYDPQGVRGTTAPANFLDWRAQAKSLSGFAAWVPTSITVTGLDRPHQVAGAAVTANFFETLGVKPVLGRTFLPGEDGLDGASSVAHTAVISYRYWQEELGGDPSVIGRTIRLDLQPSTIIGVMPRNFQFWWRPHDIWAPIPMDI